MPTGFKICGLTRPQDALLAAEVGAECVGVVFAGGPRMLTAERAAAVLAEVPANVRRVGVFGSQGPDEIGRVAARAGLHVAQLHGDADAETVIRVREQTGLAVWAVVRLAPGDALPDLTDLASASDALLLDARSPSGLGGSGIRLQWNALAPGLRDLRARAARFRLILAGGLRPGNVEDAVAAVGPDLVDVSSGVESAPGIKDAVFVREFAKAVCRSNIRIS